MWGKQDWAGRASDCDERLNKSLPTQQAALGQRSEECCVGQTWTLVIPACTVLAGGYPERTWLRLKCVTDSEGTAARSCWSTACLEAG